MNDAAFNQSREFLETQMKECADFNEKKEILQVYQKLLELKSEYDKETDKAIIEKQIREAEFFAQTQQNLQDNNANVQTNYNNAYFQTQQNYHTQQANISGHYYDYQGNLANAVAPHIPNMINNNIR